MDIVNKLISILGSNKVLTGEALLEKYNHIWTMDQPLNVKVYLLPNSTKDISEICKVCYEYDQPMVVFGGLTNLVGGTETKGNEVVISMEKLNR